MTRDRLILILALIGAIFVFWFTDFGRSGQVRVYDCGMAEWHPDIPKEVREECRRIHYEEWKRQQDLEKKVIEA